MRDRCLLAVTTTTLLLLACLPARAEVDACRAPLLPAYAHNDYRNRQPLLEALALGYRGAEADLFRVGTELVVGHDRRGLRPSDTLARLYLEPLRRRLAACGHVLADSTPFHLNIELKEPDAEAFRLLLRELAAHDDLFRPPSPVRVTLVGWWPPPDSAPTPWPECLRVQHEVKHGAAAADPRGLPPVGLVSIDYGKVLTWRGRGEVPHADRLALAKARALATTFASPLRVHHAPANARIYRWLLSEGVTLIGATDLARARSLLEELAGEPADGRDPANR